MANATPSYWKVSCGSERLVAEGYPPMTLMEVTGNAVTRTIQFLRSGWAIKESLQRIGDSDRWTLDYVPSLENNWDGNLAYTQIASQEEFDLAWRHAKWTPRNLVEQHELGLDV